MNGFVTGALGALAVLVTARLVRRAAWRHGRGARFGARRVLRRIGATPEQERAVLAETDALAEAVSGLRADGRALRTELADLLGSPALDPEAVARTIDARLAGAAELKRRAAGALARIHAALGPDQRARLAALVREGPHRHGRCGHHHHRAAAA